jgi:hypothetical protein
MVEMEIIKRYKQRKKFPSLYDAFELGDRVQRLYKDIYGNSKEYKGIILAIDKKGIEIYWDTEDGKYKPGEMNIDFTHLEADEVFKGNNKYSPVRKIHQ